MPLSVGRSSRSSTSQHSQPLPVSWDVTLDASQVQFVDLDRRAAKADLTLTVPLSKLGLTRQDAKKLLDGTARLTWIAPGADDVQPQVSLKGDALVVRAAGIDGKGFFGVAPLLAIEGKDGVARTMTFRTPQATLREKDPEVRAGWGGGGLREHLTAQKAAWSSTKDRLAGERRAVRDEFEGPDRRGHLRDLRQEKRELRGVHRNVVQDIRHDMREQRQDRREVEKRDRRGQVTVTTNQT